MSPDVSDRPFPKATTPPASATQPTIGNPPAATQAADPTPVEQTRRIVGDIKESTDEALHAVQATGMGMARRQKEKLAAKIDEYTQAMEAATESLQDADKNPLAEPARKATHQLHRAADYLRSKEPAEFVEDLSRFARRRPEVVFGGLFVLGLASVRFLKASSRPGRRSEGSVARPKGATWQGSEPTPSPAPMLDPGPIGPPPADQTP